MARAAPSALPGVEGETNVPVTESLAPAGDARPITIVLRRVVRNLGEFFRRRLKTASLPAQLKSCGIVRLRSLEYRLSARQTVRPVCAQSVRLRNTDRSDPRQLPLVQFFGDNSYLGA